MNRREAIFGAAGGVLSLTTLTALHGAEEVVAPQTRDEAINLMTSVRQAQRFTDDSVAEEDIRKIVRMGLNAPSALNKQPWFFAVVTDRKLLAEIDKAAKVDPKGRLSLTGSPLAILVCYDKASDYSKFDAGVAADRMNVAANLLGYGCKTVASGAKGANEPQFREKLGIPEGYDVFVALLIGIEKERSVDGVSGATTREPQETRVSFIK